MLVVWKYAARKCKVKLNLRKKWHQTSAIQFKIDKNNISEEFKESKKEGKKIKNYTGVRGINILSSPLYLFRRTKIAVKLVA